MSRIQCSEFEPLQSRVNPNRSNVLVSGVLMAQPVSPSDLSFCLHVVYDFVCPESLQGELGESGGLVVTDKQDFVSGKPKIVSSNLLRELQPAVNAGTLAQQTEHQTLCTDEREMPTPPSR